MRPALRNIILADRLFPGAYFAADFLKRQFRLNGVRYTRFSDIAGVSIARASQAYAETPWSTLQSFASGVPRITDKGLLPEAAATNLCLYSQEMNRGAGSPWTHNSATIGENAATAPDGTLTAEKLEATGAGGRITQGFTAGATAQHAYSIFVKPGNVTSFTAILRNNTTATNVCQVQFALTGSGSVTTTTSGTGSITALADGWYRVTVVSGAAAITAADSITIYAYCGIAAAVAGDYIYAWGAQLEATAYATSYIPTTTASVTRAADVISIGSITGLDVPYTVYAKFQRASDAGAEQILVQLDDGTANERCRIVVGSTDIFRAVMTDGGVDTADVSVAGALTVGTTYNGAGRFKLDSVQACRSGTLGTEDASASVPATPTTIRIGGGIAGANAGHVYLQQIAIFPSGYADAAMQGLAP